MEYLNQKDYKEIKNIIEQFIDTPATIDNLLKSLTLFLETKNKLPEPIEKELIEKEPRIEYVMVNKEDDETSKRMKRIFKEAEIALDKFYNKIKRRKP